MDTAELNIDVVAIAKNHAGGKFRSPRAFEW